MLFVVFSGGSGRTGTYIAISMLLDRLKVEGVVDVFQTVRALRLQRMHMVQSLVRINMDNSALVLIFSSFFRYNTNSAIRLFWSSWILSNYIPILNKFYSSQ